MEDLDLKILDLFDRYNLEGNLEWSVNLETRRVIFSVRCNDLFWWGCADTEEITEENFPLIEQSINEMRIADSEWIYTWEALELWCARARKMRPQGAAYPKNEKFWPLFDDCGPFRERGLGNPRMPGEK